MSRFQSEPRDYALQLTEDGLVEADHLLLCCLKYMSHDDVRGMLEANELAPHCCDNCNEETEDDESLCDSCQYDKDVADCLQQLEDVGGFDVEAIKADLENGNVFLSDLQDGDTGEYEHEFIVLASLTNGQRSQAKQQCESYGLDYVELLAQFNALN
jgi:hypothetical protein